MEESTRNAAEQLIQRIRLVFASVMPPEPDNIALHECDECRAVRAAFKGNTRLSWQSLPDQLIEDNFDKLPLLTAEALHFILPAFLLYSLHHWDSDVWEFTVYALTPDGRIQGEEEWCREQFHLFTKEQRETLFRFLDLVLAGPAPYMDLTAMERGKKRLEEYTWGST